VTEDEVEREREARRQRAAKHAGVELACGRAHAELSDDEEWGSSQSKSTGEERRFEENREDGGR
jgi:hypothetical protein